MSKNLILLGGNGQLGKVICNKFLNNNLKHQWKVISLDYHINKSASDNIILSSNIDIDSIYNKLNTYKSSTNTEKSFDAIINVAGGWIGDSLSDKNLINTNEKLYKMNVTSTLLASHLSTHFLKRNGLLVLTGSNAVRQSQSWVSDVMISYQLTKMMVHNLNDIIIKDNLNKEFKIITLLPNTIDTESNRKSMPDADFSLWIKPEAIADKLIEIAEDNIEIRSGFLEF